MNKFIYILLFSILTIFTISCSKETPKATINNNIDNVVAVELEKIDKGYSDETLKAISVILRTNLTINNTLTNNKPVNEKYLNISKSTRNEYLKNKNNSLIEISFDKNDEYHWQKKIKKSNILEFALKNNVNLTNISDIDPIIENDKVLGINIANKFFNYEVLAKEFDLESNEIESIENGKTEIIIKGKNKGFLDYFDIDKSEQLSNDNYNYKNILNLFFNDLKIN